MFLNTLMTLGKRKFGKALFVVQKHLPEILVVVGAGGTVVGTVMACKATLKAADKIEEKKGEIADVHDAMDAGVHPEIAEKHEIVPITKEEGNKKLLGIYKDTFFEMAKIYGPSMMISGVSLAMIFKGKSLFKQRNLALAAAYTTIDTSFKKYRENVKERFGEVVDKELKYGLKSEEREVVETKPDGSVTVTKERVECVDPNMVSDYSKFFDEGCTGWTKDPELNLLFLKGQQNYFNDKLKSVGHVFLNEVYEALGIPLTKAGQIVGWVYDEENPNGDNYIDFGIYNVHSSATRDFVNGYERTILLDFNVDGDILNSL